MKNATINKQDERYKNNDKQIRKVLLIALTNRSLNLKPKEVCEKATITRPTFYAHCENVDDALKQYEDELTSGFIKRLLRTKQKGVVFTILLSFINDEKDYFSATLTSSNFYLLHHLLGKLKLRLGYKSTPKKHYELYVQQQIALICFWGKYEKFERKRIPFYVDKMAGVEIVKSDF